MLDYVFSLDYGNEERGLGGTDTPWVAMTLGEVFKIQAPILPGTDLMDQDAISSGSFKGFGIWIPF